MIKKLRMKFTGIAMLSVFVVLSVILGTINVCNYRKVLQDADHTLSILAENQGQFPKDDMKAPEKEKEKRDLKTGGTEAESIPEKNKQMMSPELPFMSRYFYVKVNDEGKITFTDTGKIAAVDEDMAQEYGQEVLEKGRTKGFISDYRYLKSVEEQETYLIFLDCERERSTFRSFLMTSILTAFAGMLAVLLLLVILSERVVRPFSESYEKQKRFITDAGHEIKTPLAIIAADAEVLEMDTGENEWLADIQKQTGRLRDLTENLIYLSRMEEHRVESEMIEFPFSDLVEETAESFQALAVTQQKTFDYEIQPMLTLYGNEPGMQKLLDILLDNALKYSDVEGHITLKLMKNGRNLCLTVYNTAEYVSRERIGHIFDRFYRMDESRNSQTGGQGIGLSIAKAIVQTHKGKIWAETADEKSLLITVILEA